MLLYQLKDQPPLIQAIFAGDPGEVQTLIVSGVDIHFEDVEGRTALHAATFCGNKLIVEELLSNGALVNVKDYRCLTPLHIACRRGHDDVVSILIDRNADCNAKDNQWQTPLHIAAANNAGICVSLLVGRVFNINVTDRGGHTSLHHAAYNGHEKIVAYLHSSGATVNCYDKQGRCAIHWACHSGHLSVLKKLVKLGAEINARDKYLYTPLHFAAAKGHKHIAQYLLQQDCDINAVNHHGNTPLHTSCLNGHELLCVELVLHGADFTARNHNGETPVHIAACSIQGDKCLQFLLMEKSAVNAQSNDGRTPLHLTAIHGRFEHAQSLIQLGADVNIQDKNGMTTLHIAAKYGHELMITILLTAHADPNITDAKGMNPLHYSALYGFVDCCRRLIQSGIDLDAVDNCRRSAVHMAAARGSEKCLDLLVSHGAKFNLPDQDCRLPIHYAANHGHYDCLFTLVASDPQVVSSQDVLGCTPLHYAAMNYVSNECFEYLIDRNADYLILSTEGFNILHYAAFAGNTLAVRLMLQKIGKHELARLINTPASLSPLHLSAYYNSYDTLDFLLVEDVNVNVVDTQHRTPLYLAALKGSIRCVSLLLQRPDIDVAVQEKKFKFNAIHAACMKGYSSTLELLLRLVHDVKVLNARDYKDRTAIMFACELGNYECLKLLLDKKAEVDCQDMFGRTALMRAASFGHDDCVLKLLEAGASVFLADVNGKTALHLAASGGHGSLIKYMLEGCDEGCIDELYDSRGYTPLHWGCLHVNEACAQTLLKYTTAVNLTGNKFTPLHCAVLSKNLANVQNFLKKTGGSAVNCQDEQGNSPLHTAVTNNLFQITKVLLQQDVDINMQNNKGWTAVSIACIRDHAILEYLVKKGGSLDLADKEGNTPLHLACLHSSVRSVRKIVKNLKRSDTAYLDRVNHQGQTALHISAKQGLVQMTSALLQAGASVILRDKRGMNPALCCAANEKVAKCLNMILCVMLYQSESTTLCPTFSSSGRCKEQKPPESQDSSDAERFSNSGSDSESF